MLYLDCSPVGCSDQARAVRLKQFLHLLPFGKGLVILCTKMGKCQAFRTCFPGNPYSIIRIQMRPPGTQFARSKGTFDDEKVRPTPEPDRIVTHPGIGAVCDHFPVNGHPVAEAGDGVHERQTFDGKGNGVCALFQFFDRDRKWNLIQWDSERFGYEPVEEGTAPGVGTDRKALTKPEFDQDMQAGDMVYVKMAEEQVHRFFLGDVTVGFCNSVSCIEEDIELFGPYEGRTRVPGRTVVPPVCSEKGYLHNTRVCMRRAKRLHPEIGRSFFTVGWRTNTTTDLRSCGCSNMSRSKYFLLAGTVLLLCLISVPVSAVLQEVTVKSTVDTVNQAKNMLTIGYPLQYGCSYPSSGAPVCTWTPMNASSLSGTVPDPAAFPLFKAGDPIVATSIGGAGGRWIALAMLYGSRPNEEYITDVIGDPGSIPDPLIGNYTLALTTDPDCSNCSGTTCRAVSADVSVASGGQTMSEKVLSPGQTFSFNGRNDGSSVSVTFVNGEASSGTCPQAQMGMSGPQPVSVYIVHVVPPAGYVQVNIRTATTTEPMAASPIVPAGTAPASTPSQAPATPSPATTPQASQLSVAAMLAMVIVGISSAKKKI